MNRKASITIEAIIAFIILFIATMTLSSSIKHLRTLGAKTERYSNIYATVISIKNMLDNSFDLFLVKKKDKLNGFNYEISFKELLSKRSYIKGETSSGTGNIGPFNIILYEVNVELFKNDSFVDSYKFNLLKYKKVLMKEFQ